MRADGVTSPAGEALDQLLEGLLQPDPDRQEGDLWPDERQPHDAARLLGMVRHFADTGYPLRRTAVNDLRGGVWEFKVGSKRFTFWDHDGAGGFVAKPRILDRRFADNDDEFWWFPDFDYGVRLGFVFVKSGQQAGESNIQEALEVREEDLAHDRDRAALEAPAE